MRTQAKWRCRSRRQSTISLKQSIGGFTIIELMIGLAVGLLVTLAVAAALITSEEQKRSTTLGMDSQVRGVVGLAILRSEISEAGYGIAPVPDILGCALSAKYNGSSISGFATALNPAAISVGPSDAPDSIRVISSAKKTYAVPMLMTKPYDPNDQKFSVQASVGVMGPAAPTYAGDLIVVAKSGSGAACELFMSNQAPDIGIVYRADDAKGWNSPGFPESHYEAGGVLINMGEFHDVTFSVDANKNLVSTEFKLDASGKPSISAPTILLSNIVGFKAVYGKDNDLDGSVDVWDNQAPATSADWQKIIAIRIAMVARSAQYEKEDVTSSNPLWDLGSSIDVTPGHPANSPCGAGGKCVMLKIDDLPNWRRYRYKVFDTVIPLHNMLWRPV